MNKSSKSLKMAGIGEVLWDILPTGKQLGGSPMNVVYHCQAAGIQSVAISAIGKDKLGEEIIKEVIKGGNSIEYIQVNEEKPTGTVSVELKDGIPDFTIHNDVAWDFLRWNDDLRKLAKDIDAVAFGSLSQRNDVTADTISKFLNEMKPDSIRVFDVNLRQNFHSKELITKSMEVANILKINDEELPVITEYLGIEGPPYNQIRELIDMFNLDLVAYTKGSNGSVLHSKELTSVRNAPKIDIEDTVGAGDTFTALLISGLLKKKPLEEIHAEASDKAAWVCTQKGGTPPY